MSDVKVSVKLECVWLLSCFLNCLSGLIWLRIGTGAGACECPNEPTGSIKCLKFLEYVRTA